ncbi:MAG: DUF429 domain-containing protein [Thermoanaerobaculia bacterium]
MLVAGTDGCPAGWICLRRRMKSREIHPQVFINAADLLDQRPRPSVLTIDVPIGLSDSGARFCDHAARRVLGARASSVFPAPIRPALSARTYGSACRITLERTGKQISRQAWAIYPKVREIDRAMIERPSLQGAVHEVHPEVSFWAWNGGVAIEPPKRTRAGRDARRLLVDSHFGPDSFELVRHRYRASDVTDEDILDAFAALWTAERIATGTAGTLPDVVPLDTAGLRMEIVY